MNLRLATAAAAGAMVLAAVPAATATAHTPDSGPALASTAAQAPVQEYSATVDATVTDAQMTVRGTQVTLDLTGSADITLASPTPGSLEAEASLNLALTGTHPELGKITVKGESTADSTVTFNSVVSPFPAQVDIHTDLTINIENAPAASTRSMAKEPLILDTKNPGRLIGQIEQFPPQGAPYKLQYPIELVAPNREETIASIDKFPTTVGDFSGS